MIETIDNLKQKKIDEIVKWHCDNIGTDYEVNESASGIKGHFYVCFFELEQHDYSKLRDYLRSKQIEFY